MAASVRTILALLFCFAALAVLGQMTWIRESDGLHLRAPIFALAPWAFALHPRRRLATALAAAALACIAGAFLIIAGPLAQFRQPGVVDGLGSAGFLALGAALVVHAVAVIKGWRAQRARLRSASRGRLERLSGGF